MLFLNSGLPHMKCGSNAVEQTTNLYKRRHHGSSSTMLLPLAADVSLQEENIPINVSCISEFLSRGTCYAWRRLLIRQPFTSYVLQKYAHSSVTRSPAPFSDDSCISISVASQTKPYKMGENKTLTMIAGHWLSGHLSLHRLCTSSAYQ